MICPAHLTCDIRLFPLQLWSLFWRFLDVLRHRTESLRGSGDVLFLSVGRQFFRMLAVLTAAVQHGHPDPGHALPLEVSALQRLLRDEIEAPAAGRILQVLPQGVAVLRLELLAIHRTEQVSPRRPVSEGSQDPLVRRHDLKLQRHERWLPGSPNTDQRLSMRLSSPADLVLPDPSPALRCHVWVSLLFCEQLLKAAVSHEQQWHVRACSTACSDSVWPAEGNYTVLVLYKHSILFISTYTNKKKWLFSFQGEQNPDTLNIHTKPLLR